MKMDRVCISLIATFLMLATISESRPCFGVPVRCFFDMCTTVRCVQGFVCVRYFCGGCRAKCVPQPRPQPRPCWRVMCPAVWKPVCGSDGKTYSNSCHLNGARCRKKSLRVLHNGACGIVTPVKKCDRFKICPAVWQPVVEMVWK